MDVLVPAVYAAISGDSELAGMTKSITTFRQPTDPSILRGQDPAVVIDVDGGEDENGLHGAAVNPEVEVSVWGYDASGWPKCWRAAQRVSEIVAGGIDLDSGVHLRLGEFVSWQQIDQPDPKTVLLRAVFKGRYWSVGRIEAITD